MGSLLGIYLAHTTSSIKNSKESSWHVICFNRWNCWSLVSVFIQKHYFRKMQDLKGFWVPICVRYTVGRSTEVS